jgi:hypothetical protein
MSSMHANSCHNECKYIPQINRINFIGGCYVNFMSNWVTFTVYYDQIYLVLTSSSLLFGSAPFSINNSTIWVSALDTATWSGVFPCRLKIHTYIQIYLPKVVPKYLITYFIGYMITYETICDFFIISIYIYLSLASKKRLVRVLKYCVKTC